MSLQMYSQAMRNQNNTYFGSFLSAAFWVLATAGFAAAAYHSALPFGPNAWNSYRELMSACDANPSAAVYVLVWGAMVLAALGSIVRRVSGVRGTWGASVALMMGSVIALSERFQGGELSVFDSDRGALLMIAAALAFAGSSRLWWLVLAPILVGVAIVPLAWMEFWQTVASGDLVRAAIPAVTAAIVASLIVVVRETRARVLEARSGISEVTQREAAVATALVQFTSSLAIPPRRESSELSAAPEQTLQAAIESLTTVEIASPSAPLVSSSVTYQDLQALANEALEAVRAKWAGRSDVRLLLTAPSDLSLPIAVRATNDEIRIWLRSLVENAVDALGGGRGVVRLTLKPNLTHVAISVEDNGRGLGEDLYSKLGVEDPARLKLDDVKAQVTQLGARLDLHSRLGVGTRATLELSRIDALSALTRASRETSARIPAFRPNPDSSSLHA